MAKRTEMNDSIFLKSISCPLKNYHILEGHRNRKPYLPFKQRNKLQLRDVLASKFSDTVQTPDSVSLAAEATERFLKQENVTICGAVVKWGNFITRIPILSKKGKTYTIIQIHGKLRKRQNAGVVPVPVLSKSTEAYLIKAAYRLAVLKNVLKPDDCQVQFCFPDKRYRAGFDNVLQTLNSSNTAGSVSEIESEIDNLFTTMDATAATESVLKAIPESVAHSRVAGRSVTDVMMDLTDGKFSGPEKLEILPHEECGRCEFRDKDPDNSANCWSTFFDGNNKTYPKRHIFELIGHGNQELLSEGIYYQEDCPLPEGATSFEAIRKRNPHAITIQHRRELQLLKAHGREVPNVWLKPKSLGFDQLTYPLHFIDFEAATYAIPMKRAVGAYSPVYFQFSCHTLFESGEIVHTEWLDDKYDSGYPHLDFIKQLGNVDSIFEGNLVQYSPFESQALRFLLQEMKWNSMLYGEEIDILERLLYKDGETHNHRVFDLSKSVREAYYNRYMGGSIGLKQILQSIFRLKEMNKAPFTKLDKVYDRGIDFSRVNREVNYDPYSFLQDPVYKIDDGEAAMNAYISLKSGLLSDEESAVIPTLLKRYCAMDSYALFIIYDHLLELMADPSKYDQVAIDR